MSTVAIQASHLSKRYRLGQITRHTLRDEMTYFVHRLRGRRPTDHMGTVGGKPRSSSGEFWALKDISFEIQTGEIVGIIGGNGAGKSTLLKILSRITEPSEGEALIRGRIGSLLEVGTGFHPDLTGRENIYMNGTILGMKRAEITRRFDEIVEFAEIGNFLDTPVKRYSSGMYVRLAFAVAAHLETEILLVDEVLAVGDAKFQKKCMGKMGDAAQAGRTILFVSHNLQAIRTLCPRSILLTQGSAEGPLPTSEALHHYVGFDSHTLNAVWRPASPGCVTTAFLAQEGRTTPLLLLSKPFELGFTLSPEVLHEPTHLAIHILDEQGVIIHHSVDMFDAAQRPDWQTGHRLATVPAHALAPGRYTLCLWVWHRTRGLISQAMNVLTWEVGADGPIFTAYPVSLWKGVTGPGLLTWKCLSSLDLPAPAGHR